MRNLPLKRPPAHVPMRTLFMLALAIAIAALAVLPLAHPAQAHAADPAVLTVTEAADTGDEGTLRWALGKVNLGEAARIEFNTTAMGSSVIELLSPLPTIVSAVEIAGPAGGVTIKKASTAPMPDGWRHLSIISTKAFDVSISNVTFEGPGAQGAVSKMENGGIYVDAGFPGALELTDCTLRDNYNDKGNAEDPKTVSRGGAIHVLSTDAELRMTRCVVQGNTAFSFGGGVYSLSPLYAKDCSFLGNFSKGDSAGGGALLSTDEAELTGCTVDGNHSDGDSGGVQSGALTMTDCTVTNNTAGAPGALSTGGGVGAEDLVMTGCEVTGNSCLFSGGGIYASTSAEITESTVSGNNSDGIGGGAFIARKGVVQSSEIVDNTSSNVGAGVVVGDETGEEVSSLEVVDSAIKGNKSLDSGGGIFLYDNCALTLTNATVSQNEADFSGGGVYGELTASLVMKGGQITGNKANASGGGVLLETGDASLERCVVSENTAVDSSGGLLVRGLTARDVRLSRNVAGAEGGGALVSASLEASGSTFDGNEANSGGGLIASVVALTNCTVSGNTAQEEGGGVAGLEVELLNCTVSGNTSGAATALQITGGGVLANKLSMLGCIVAGNYDASGNHNELAVGTTVDNGDGTVSDSHGTKNIVGIPASGLATILETQKDASGREVGVLKDNEGPTPTIMITADGPAQDIVTEEDYAVPAVDQRGIGRPVGLLADIGAVEVSGLSRKYDVDLSFDVYRGGDQPLTGKVGAPLRSVLGVQMNGADLESGKHYTLTEGSTVITLLPSYLKTLKSGSHQVVISFTNGSATLPLKVELPQPKPDDPVKPDPVDPKPVDPTNPVQPANPTDPGQPAKPKVLARMGDDAGPFVVALGLTVAVAAAALGVARRRLG